MTHRGGSRDRPSSDRAVNLATVALPVVLAGALAAYELGTRSLWLDEGATVAIASQHGAALWRAIGHDGGNMLVYYLLIHAVIAVFGAGDLAIRIPSVIATAVTAGIVATLGLRLFDRRVALAAGGLVAVSLPLTFWGQDARGYALMVTLAAASFLAFAMVVDGSRWAIWAYGLATLLAIYVGFDAVLIVPAQLLLLLGARRVARRVLVCLAAVAVACVPLLLLALSRGSSQLFWVPSPSLAVLGQAAVTLTSAGMPPNFHATATTTATVILTVALILALLGLIAWRARHDRPWPVLLLCAWIVVPTVLALLAAVAGEPIELARAGVLLIPAIALLVGWGAARQRLPPGAGWGLVGALVVLRVLALAPSYGVSPENWRAASRYVLGTSRGGACIAFYPEDGRMPFDFYVHDRPATADLHPVLPRLVFAQVRPFVERYVVPGPARLDAIAAQCPRLWLVASHEGQRHGPPASARDFRHYKSLFAALALRYTRQRAHRFGYAAVVRAVLFSR